MNHETKHYMAFNWFKWSEVFTGIPNLHDVAANQMACLLQPHLLLNIISYIITQLLNGGRENNAAP